MVIGLYRFRFENLTFFFKTCFLVSVYRKWNENFFRENVLAYRSGRMEKDPAECWYQGEIGFFDFYIVSFDIFCRGFIRLDMPFPFSMNYVVAVVVVVQIPLAKKLKDCGVFGVSSDEYLNYALQNRAEWEARGQQVVAEMMENMN